ncbi:MAG: hypothetical protein IKG93_00825 [Clostridiales bacterium]|nr:hypothetical protein [Clostridiales bacterium]
MIAIIGLIFIVLMILACGDRERDTHKGCLYIFLGIGIFVLLGVGYMFYTVSQFIEADKKWYPCTTQTVEDKERWSSDILLPEAVNCFEYYSHRSYHRTHMVETYAYNSVEDMCSALPDECEKAISSALNSSPEKEKDIRGVKVKQYTIDNDLLPLIDVNEMEEQYSFSSFDSKREYYINEYEDGTYRFVASFEIL